MERFKILQALQNQTRKKEIQYDLSEDDEDKVEAEGSSNKNGKTKPRFDVVKIIEDAEISLRPSLTMILAETS
ncbi:hypothetical protein Glove_139g46 [Diversispora epigaea]|uniref:Uncharacterized protein n=1 Tax=Diversispora epigaea TaxID=1348612 RepID=A0A397J263_9GLOM|nr:hypothetical protein Glove_139g46 [Diversispora epigaea]